MLKWPKKRQKVKTLAASVFLPSSRWVDREEMEWQQGRGSEKSGSEGEKEKACGVRMRRQTGRAERERERELREGGGGDLMNYDQGTLNTHLARCFISSPRTCRFLSGSLWTRQWMAWIRDSGLPPSVQTQEQQCTCIKLHAILCVPQVAWSQHSWEWILYSTSTVNWKGFTC